MRFISPPKAAHMSTSVVELILNDHRELERLFGQLQTEPDKRPSLVPVMVALLTAHSRAEESEVYPVAAEAGIAEDVEHSQKEHLEADQLAAEVADADFDSPDFGNKLDELIKAVRHHVEEEESTVLAEMTTRLSDDLLGELGHAFLASREQHLGDMPDDITRAEMAQQAANAGLSGVSDKPKDELAADLKDAAEL